MPPIETASLATVNEIREAASQDPYPQWIYGALVSPEASAYSNVQPAQGALVFSIYVARHLCIIFLFADLGAFD